MKRLLHPALAPALIAIVLSACAFAQSEVAKGSAAKQNISGKWTGSFDTTIADGSVHKDTAVLIFKQDGNVLTGTVGPSEDQQSPLTDGTVHDREIHFNIEHNGGSMVFSLRLEGDHLIGEVGGSLPEGGGKIKIDTTRANGEAGHPAPVSALYDEISHMDTVLFDAFNTRDLPRLRTLFTEDLEFYHDKGGLSSYQKNMEMFQANFERATRVRRELVAGSLEVYPIEGYGAVEIGVHRFYSTDPGQAEKLTATAKFLHVWQKKDGAWKISRVVSYDHR